ncbi:transmembrane protein, putative [Medicago truncatula]|uniref:Transmembrane protein, putative n=1 Tax=Medicago truncatula TaxID=3880 RepID=G7KK42_MEDTR|nr:transmembrane protein, putative [Medicago truncatula]
MDQSTTHNQHNKHGVAVSIQNGIGTGGICRHVTNIRDILLFFQVLEKCKHVSTLLIENEKLSKNNVDNNADASICKSIIRSLLYLPGIWFVVFSLSSKKQEMVSQSSAEAEYIFVVAVTNKLFVVAVWVHNKYGIAIIKNSVQLGRTKHIDVKYQSIREAEK